VGTGSNQAEMRLGRGHIGRAAGFDLFEVNNTPNSNTIIAGHRIGATFAGQIAQVEAYRQERRFGDGLKGLSLYGALGHDEHLIDYHNFSFQLIRL